MKLCSLPVYLIIDFGFGDIGVIGVLRYWKLEIIFKIKRRIFGKEKGTTEDHLFYEEFLLKLILL